MSVQRYVENAVKVTCVTGMNTDLSVADFEGTELKTNQPLAVVFTANWCPFCSMFTPIFKSTLSKNQLPYGSVDLTSYDNPLWETFDIEVVPTVVVFKNGKAAYRADGVYGRGLPKSVVDDVVRELGAARN
ncbi:MAG TPA: thioredoxin family protein [Candidatus Bathyarchaeia archaeon]|nr:thioredoxin family protein [Candidatus Bathyarchaeia archaeon]